MNIGHEVRDTSWRGVTLYEVSAADTLAGCMWNYFQGTLPPLRRHAECTNAERRLMSDYEVTLVNDNSNQPRTLIFAVFVC